MELRYEINIYNAMSQTNFQISSDVILVSLIDGEATIEFEQEEVVLEKGEVYVINFGKLYSISGKADTVIAEVRIDYVKLLNSTKKRGLKFYCNTLNDNTQNHYQIKKLFSKLIRLHVDKGRLFEEWSVFYAMIDLLMTKYSRYSTSDDKEYEDERINEVCIYLHTHYKNKISLNEICRRFGFSTSTLTRNFKNQTSKSLIQYLNEIRIQAAKQMLLEKNVSITDVALEVGFADATTFIKKFKKINGISPLKFKQKMAEQKSHNIANKDLILLVERNYQYHKNELKNNVVTRKNEITLNNEMIYEKNWTKAIGVQEASALLDRQYCENVVKIKSTGIKYIRVPFLFSKDLIYLNNDSKYDFHRIDCILDFIIQNNMLPIIELSGRKICVLEKGHSIAISEEGAYDYTYEEYVTLVRSFIEHVYVRYSGFDDWIWELQYERDRYSYQQYFDMFALFSNQLHSLSDDIKVGGYGIDLYAWKEEMHQFTKYQFKPDFLSANLYPYKLIERKGKWLYLERVMDTLYLRNQILDFKEKLNNSGLSKTPIYITSWNTTLLNHSVLNDSYIKVSMMMGMITGLFDLIDMYIYDTVSDFDKNCDNASILSGEKGLITKDGLEKAPFHVFYGLSLIGKKVTVCNDRLIFSYRNHDVLSGICFNQKAFNISFNQKAESSIQAKDFRQMIVDGDILEQSISISNLHYTRYRIKMINVGEERSVLTLLEKMGKDIHYCFEDLQYLKRQSSYDMQIMEKEVHEGKLEFTIEVKPLEMAIISITPME
ncbi:AraC-type DNA-binding protein [Sharpea azabuensis]|uniref:AraC family transcriptional regulator n=1 Tax=Sharpea azabuensis TaxID=322505 RepID=UPI0008E091A2|nr:helix-turn-helix domain-containing protein [Sharpea azabuensis]SFD84444.1 AraC-type DNA-binding protein [Sharpea azabuensis]SFK79981.1 AraC-type DNA-binding protein [Sharpea azabuensis]